MSLGLPSVYVKYETEEHGISQNQNMEIPQEKMTHFLPQINDKEEIKGWKEREETITD